MRALALPAVLLSLTGCHLLLPFRAGDGSSSTDRGGGELVDASGEWLDATGERGGPGTDATAVDRPKPIWSQTTMVGINLTGVSGPSTSPFVVGNSAGFGVAYHRITTNWPQVVLPAGTGPLLGAAHVAGSGAAIFVGTGVALLCDPGATPNCVSLGCSIGKGEFRGVWVAPTGNEAWLVGTGSTAGGVVYKWTRSVGCSQISANWIDFVPAAVWGDGAGKVYVVGSSTLPATAAPVWAYDSTTGWTAQKACANSLYSISGTSSGAYAVGSLTLSGSFSVCRGPASSWTLESISSSIATPEKLHGVWTTGTLTVIAGENGTLLAKRSGVWKKEDLKSTALLRAVWASTVGTTEEIIAVSEQGIVFQNR